MADEDDNEDFEEERREELKRLLEEEGGDVLSDENLDETNEWEDPDFTSKEYRTFKEEEKGQEERSLYEKLCNLSERIVKIEPSPERKENIQRAIDFAYMDITPEGSYSFAILTGISIVTLSFVFLALGLSNFIFTLFLSFMGAVSVYLLAKFPESQAKLFRVKASNEIMLAVIYIVIYMRSTPNLEGAIRFAAQHLDGPLSLDFKKILWDVETRKYSSIKAALVDYLDKWRDNPTFVESMQIIQNSMEQSDERRKSMLDEAVNKMMSGTRENMKRYSNSLELPIMIIHALGVMLPMMVLVMFPIIILVLNESVRPIFLAIGYDIVLPLIIYLTGKRTLEYRPFGFSSSDVSLHPDNRPDGKMSIAGRLVSIWPFSLLISVVTVILGIFVMGSVSSESIFMEMSTSLIITIGIGMGPASYFLLNSRNKMGLRRKVESVESEFSEVLFSLGNRLSLGEPIEKAMGMTVEKNEELDITDLFQKSIRNMRRGGMNLKKSLFDEEFGAVWDYPSKLIMSIMKIVVESTEKSVSTASSSAISISKYLKNIKDIEEDMKDMLSSEVASMEFLGAFLGPLVAGVAVTMAAIMIDIFFQLGTSLEQLNLQSIPGGMGLNSMMIGGWGSVGEMIPISWIQIISGIYVVETSYLLAMITSGIEDGPGDKVSRQHTAAILIIVALLVYSFSMLLTWQVFGAEIEGLLAGSMTFGG